MKISYNWLKQYIDVDLDPKKVAEILTNTGLEVEGIESFETVKSGLEGVVVGKVKSVRKHPNADKLTLTEVDLGHGHVVPIVCGAPNVEAGQKVPVAVVGTTLYKGDEPLRIKKTKIRGKISEGMICAEDELGLGDSHEGIMVLDKDATVGMDAKTYFNIKTDTIFEIGLTPNRIDGASHYGVARDLAAYLNQFEKKKVYLPSINHFKTDNEEHIIPVIIKNVEACPRYAGLTISGIKVGSSPDWLQNRLRSIGLSPINNIVDITNYVLHETGQPLHAFDADIIDGNKIIVKTLNEGSRFVTLDEEVRVLSENDLMICNEKDGMCIAGIFGGINSGVTEKTTSLFLESACFDPVYIRKTSKRHLLNTDASFRFERGADPEMTLYALKRAALLIKEIAGGKISSPVQDVYPEPFEPVTIKLSYANLKRLIGNVIPAEDVKKILASLDFEITEETGDNLILKAPLYRVDVTREADVIEEVLRIYGYNQIGINQRSNIAVNHFEKPDKEKIINQISDLLCSNGFYEIMTNSLTKGEHYGKNKAFDENKSVKLFNPLSLDLNVMRQSLLFGGLEAIKYNINRKRNNLKMFEFGTCYWLDSVNAPPQHLNNYMEEQQLALFVTGNKTEDSWNAKEQSTDFYYLKGVISLILQRIGINEDELEVSGDIGPVYAEGMKYSLNSQELVRFGIVSKNTLIQFDVNQPVYFAEFKYEILHKAIGRTNIQFKAMPRFPEVRRDLALLLNSDIRFERIKELALKTEKKLLKQVRIFDVYTGEKLGAGKKSYAISFTLQDPEKTLTDKQIDKVMQNLMNVFKDQLGAQIR